MPTSRTPGDPPRSEPLPPPTGRPPLDSVGRFLFWQASRQPRTLGFGVLWGVVWMLCQAVWPYLLGRAIDEGIAGDRALLWRWCLALLGIAAVQALTGMLRHRMAVTNWLRSSLGIARLIGYHSAETGPAITATTASGEIVATVSTDALRLGEMFDVSARLGGSVVAFVVVALVMLHQSLQLGLVVLIGVPLVGLFLALLIGPLQKRQLQWREQTGRLMTLGADTVIGLRVLRGIGGEAEFVERYGVQSGHVREAGVGVARTQSWLQGLQILLPGLFLVVVVWYGARLAMEGQISAGELATFYGYATFLNLPLSTGVEGAQAFIRGFVAARRVLAVLRTEPAAKDSPSTHEQPPPGSELVDVASGVTIEPGRFTAIVDADQDAAAAIATRLGRFDDTVQRQTPVLWGGLDLTAVRIGDVRRRIVVNDSNPHLFGGRLIDALDVAPTRDPEFTDTRTGRIRRVSAALAAAAATETVEALPGGYEETVAERGRSFSGGQRQRLGLARALLTDAEILVLIEPTSAVDAHTEAAIGRSLREAREGRTTVIVTASPLLLANVDRVIVMQRGAIVGTGRHEELLRREDESGDAYRAIVSRTLNDAEPERDVDIDAAMTGAIDTLWTATHPVQDGPDSERSENDAADTEEEAGHAAADRE